MSEIRANTISDTAGTGPVTLTKQSAAKAWSNYNHSTTSIRETFNVGSITDLGTGKYTINFTAGMANATYSAVCSGGSSGIIAGMAYMYSPTTSGTNVEVVNANNTLLDAVYTNTSVFGDLA